MTSASRPPAAGYTGIGSLPGEGIDAAVGFAFDASPELPWLPELPTRGPGSDMLGRTLAAIAEATGEWGFDLQPAGWRLVSRPGFDAAAARARLTGDLDALLVFGDFDGTVKTQLAGPWTLAAGVELPRGGRTLGDAGAVRDIVAGLAVAAADQVSQLRRRMPAAQVMLQVDEPLLPAVVEGSVSSQSGLGTIAGVPEPDVISALETVSAAAGVPVVMHCCAASPPLEVFAAAGAGAVSFDVTRLVAGERLDEDRLSALLERGLQLWLGVLPGLGPGVAPPPRAVADPVRRLWRSLGWPVERLAQDVVLTTSCGLARASAGWMSESMRVLRQAARALSEAPETLRS